MAKRYAISLTTWEEHQERPDRANYVWFKVYQKMLTGSFWTGSTLAQKAMWIALMCIRNAQEQETILIPDFVLAGHCGEGVKVQEVETILIGLHSLGVIQDESGKFPGQAQEFAWPREEKNREEERRVEKSRKAGRVPAPPYLAPQLVGDYSPKAKSILDACPKESQEGWIAAYPDPAWIRQEVNKAAAWLAANPKKPTKNLAKFMGNWLGRGWESFRKTIPSTPNSSAINYDKIFGGKDAS